MREAVISLIREELIEVYPQRSTKVTRIDVNVIDQSIFGIKALEEAIINEACRMIHHHSIDGILKAIEAEEKAAKEGNIFEFASALYNFHFTFFTAFNKQKLFCVFDRFFFHIVREWMLEISLIPIEQIIKEQRALIEAIEDHNCNNALMHHTFYIDYLKCDHESLKTAYGSYFLDC